MNNPNLYIRQTGIIDPEKLTMPIAIIGAGSIGSWTALCLGKLGCSNITVFDFDRVEEHNVGSQIYKESDEGDIKVEALQKRLSFLLENDIVTVNAKWTKEQDLSEYKVIIAAVDNITCRKELFEHLKGTQKFFVDARMASNTIEIYTAYMEVPECLKAYEATLFEEKDTLPIPCSERSVAYNVFVVAGLIGNIIAKYANKQEIPDELVVDLINFTLFK
jgi:molybdopterin/thiamine biosynthesis adenylyltransferase